MKWYDRELGRTARLGDRALALVAVRRRQRARGHHAHARGTSAALGEVRRRLFQRAHWRGRHRWWLGLSPVQRTAYRALVRSGGEQGFMIRQTWYNPWWDW